MSKGRPGRRRERRDPAHDPWWLDMVALSGAWLEQQAHRPGAPGAAAGLARSALHRSARMVSEVGAEVARATAAEQRDHPPPDDETAGKHVRVRRFKPEG
ncbi:MAG: hypothetical protein ACREN4_03980 [Candidatus Dormibacteria bacterium]